MVKKLVWYYMIVIWYKVHNKFSLQDWTHNWIVVFFFFFFCFLIHVTADLLQQCHYYSLCHIYIQYQSYSSYIVIEIK